MDINFHHHVTIGVDDCLLRMLAELLYDNREKNGALKSIAGSLESLATDVKLIRRKYSGVVDSDVHDISVSQVKESPMAKKVLVIKKTPGMAKMRVATKAALPGLPGVGAIIDGGQGVFTVTGLDSETPPQPVDISGLAVLTVSSADPNLVPGPVSGMTDAITSPNLGASGTGVVTFTATANDGSFTDVTTANVSYSGGAITGIQVIQTA